VNTVKNPEICNSSGCRKYLIKGNSRLTSGYGQNFNYRQLIMFQESAWLGIELVWRMVKRCFKDLRYVSHTARLLFPTFIRDAFRISTSFRTLKGHFVPHYLRLTSGYG